MSAHKEESWFLVVDGSESCFGRGGENTSGVCMEKTMTSVETRREKKKQERENRQYRKLPYYDPPF